jgi:hypothetical protein
VIARIVKKDCSKVGFSPNNNHPPRPAERSIVALQAETRYGETRARDQYSMNFDKPPGRTAIKTAAAIVEGVILKSAPVRIKRVDHKHPHRHILNTTVLGW